MTAKRAKKERSGGFLKPGKRQSVLRAGSCGQAAEVAWAKRAPPGAQLSGVETITTHKEPQGAGDPSLPAEHSAGPFPETRQGDHTGKRCCQKEYADPDGAPLASM